MQKVISLPSGDLPVMIDLAGSVDDLRVRVRFVSTRPELLEVLLDDPGEVPPFEVFAGEWTCPLGSVSDPEAWDGELALQGDLQDPQITIPSYDVPIVFSAGFAQFFDDPTLLTAVVDEGVEAMLANLDRLEAMHEQRISDYEAQIEQVRGDLASVREEKGRWAAIPASLPAGADESRRT